MTELRSIHSFRVFRLFRGFAPPMSAPLELPGLSVHLDQLGYESGGLELPPDKPHACIYFLTIRNQSDRTVTLLGRKWVIEHVDGTRLVVEGDKIVGEAPTLAPGEKFSYNSYHIGACDARAHGAFHGL